MNNGSSKPLMLTSGIQSTTRSEIFSPRIFNLSSCLQKGLGTSKDSDARDYFSHMEKHMISFAKTQEGDKELIELAFSKKKADERKEWLRQLKVWIV